MSMTKMIEIDGREVAFRASAAIPQIYRLKFQRDIYKDLSALEKAVGKEDEGSSNTGLVLAGNVREYRLRDGEARGRFYPGYAGGMAGWVGDVLHLPGAAEADRAVGGECEDGCGG